MERSLIDRWTDTTAFSCLLVASSIVVWPVVAMGVVITVIGGAAVLIDGAVDIAQAALALSSVGGALGFVGYIRALMGARNPARHNIMATLVCLAAGVITAFAVAVSALILAVLAWTTPWGNQGVVAASVLFAAATLIWALSGIGWMQRLPSRYADKTGREFDSVPVILLFVALALATAAVLATAAL